MQQVSLDESIQWLNVRRQAYRDSDYKLHTLHQASKQKSPATACCLTGGHMSICSTFWTLSLPTACNMCSICACLSTVACLIPFLSFSYLWGSLQRWPQPITSLDSTAFSLTPITSLDISNGLTASIKSGFHLNILSSNFNISISPTIYSGRGKKKKSFWTLLCICDAQCYAKNQP